jgi:hypothetical protein
MGIISKANNRLGAQMKRPKSAIGHDCTCSLLRPKESSARTGDLLEIQPPTCGAKNRDHLPCGNRPLAGRRRCRFHGGLSTGPRTAEGRARIALAQKRRWGTAPTPALIDRYREADEEMASDSFMAI